MLSGVEMVASDIRLARAGLVTYRNFAGLGYQRLIRGVYGRLPSTDGLDDWQRRRASFIARTQAAVAVYSDKSVALFGPTALQVLGVALPETVADWDHCHVLVTHDVARPVRQGVVAHHTRAPRQLWRDVAGLPLLHPVDHWLQLRGATDDELIEVGDGLLRRKQPLLTMPEVLARLNQLGSRPGVKRVRRLLRWVVPGTDSLYETRTRLALVRAGLPAPAVNLPVVARSSGRLFHVDLGYAEERVAVEYDGAVHVGDRRQMEVDANRRRLLQDEGWLIITVTADQLRHPEQVVRSVETALIMRRFARANVW